METIKLTVHEREETGNGPARRLRAQGLIPGVSYGKGTDATAISIDLEDLKAALAHGHNVVLELDFGKGAKGAKGATKSKVATRYAVVKEIQFHPTKRSVLHVDLHEVDLAVEIEATVAIELVGTPAGVADGGVLEWEHREVVVRALPADVPAVLEARRERARRSAITCRSAALSTARGRHHRGRSRDAHRRSRSAAGRGGRLSQRPKRLPEPEVIGGQQERGVAPRSGRSGR